MLFQNLNSWNKLGGQLSVLNKLIKQGGRMRMKKIKSALAYIGVAIFLAGCTPTPQPDLKVGKLVPADAVMCEETTEFMKYSVTRV